MTPEQLREARVEARAEGYCIDLCGRFATDGEVRCAVCAETKADRENAIARARRAARKCPRCGHKLNLFYPFTNCAGCRRYYREQKANPRRPTHARP